MPTAQHALQLDAHLVFCLHGYGMSIHATVVAGGLRMLMVTLDQRKCIAKRAFPVLVHLVDTGTLPAEEAHANEILMARLQGLRRCSTLLCPLYSQDQEDRDEQLGRDRKAQLGRGALLTNPEWTTLGVIPKFMMVLAPRS